MPRSLRVIGPGRAGRAMALALEGRGWQVAGMLARGDDVTHAAEGVHLLLISTQDPAVAPVAAAVSPVPTTVVAHVAGSLGLDVLAPHERRAAIHPLVALPDPERGAARLTSGSAWFGLAVGGDPVGDEIVESLGGHAVRVADDDRAAYHAAAAIVSNHIVGLLGQAERIAATVGVPLSAYLDLARVTVENVAALGPAAALTGPVKRREEATLARHREAIPADELAAYEAGVELCRRLL